MTDNPHKAIYVLGDIHYNDFSTIRYWINHYHLKDIIIIQVGDFGIGFRKNDMEVLALLNKFLKIRNVELYAIRGNHDNPDFFKGKYKWSNITLVPDYTILNLNDKNFLFVGGAISIDRVDLIMNHGQGDGEGKWWFRDEVFVNPNADQHKMIMETSIDYVITHTTPNFCWPYDFNGLVYKYAANDDKLLEELRVERGNLTKLYETISMNSNIKKWYHGHFHSSHITEFRGTDFILLGIDELKEVR